MPDFKKKNNPYTLQFSYYPPEYIRRQSIFESIINDYTRDIPSFRAHFLTGVRGSGKSVTMVEISNYLRDYEDWIIVEAK